MVRPEKHSRIQLPSACRKEPVALSDELGVSAVVADCDAVVYCAGSVRGRRPADFSAANIIGVKAMLSALEQTPNAPPLLLVSSLAASKPQLSDYAHSKFEGEQLVLGKPLLSWAILRPPAVYGPGDTEMLPLFKMARRGLLTHAGSREQRLSLLHVDDLARAVVDWLGAWQHCVHKTYSIDDGRSGGYDWSSIGETITPGKFRLLKIPRFLLNFAARINLLLSMVLGYAPMLTPGKVRELIQPQWLCDNRQFSAATGWEPSIDLSRGIQQLFCDI